MRPRQTTRTSTVAAVLLALLAALLAAPPAAAAASGPVTVLSHGFEDGTTQGWTPRASDSVAVSTALARTGAASLASTGRTAGWNGPTLDLLGTLEQGTRYTFSVYVRLAPGESATTLRMSVERRSGSTPSYDQVAGSTNAGEGAWTQLTGTYTLAHDVDFLTVYIESASATAAFHVDDFTLTYTPPRPIQTDIPALKDVLAPHFPIGAAITRAETLGVHGELLARHFDSVTPGNALKWDATQPTEGDFRFADGDALIGYGAEHGMAVRGHTLVWHNQTPSWVFDDASGEPMTATPENKALLLSRLDAHIRAVVGHFGDAIGTWDVVNEVIDESQGDGLRRSRWFELTGLDYIRTAFRVAREAAPEAKLFINDYNTNVPAKRDKLHALVAQLLAEGVPVDGVGHQMHVTFEWPSVAETGEMLDRFAPLGVEQQITEMDMSVYRDSGESFPTPPADRLLTQGHRYQAMFDLFRAHDDQIGSVTLWGLADDSTWLDTFPVTRKDHPLLFDTELQAKPAYWGIVDPGQIGNPPGGQGCTVAYRTSSWQGGFQATVTVTSATAVAGWSLAWTFADGQRVTQMWNGRRTQNDAEVTVVNEPYNAVIAAGGSVSFGFLGSWSGTNASPTAFRFNGTACAVV
ncbi:endo-1,4-beta-xylanase [Phytomonospora sp. NPDC050363]|uniref:endo-1,4-beta-xylanase n=1 Tax=Phytomonospora sp. NPDC050363 TaxID=3155642 RepID=UPI0033DB4D27